MKKLWFFTLFSFAFAEERSFRKDLIQALTEEHEGPYEIQRLRRATTIEQINAAAVALTRYFLSVKVKINIRILGALKSLTRQSNLYQKFRIALKTTGLTSQPILIRFRTGMS